MKVLIVVDVQNDFCPGGALAVPGGSDVVPIINDLMPRYDYVVLTQDWHPEDHLSFAAQHEGKQPFETVELEYGTQVLWPNHCVQGSRGAEFHPSLAVERAHAIIRKGFRRHIDSYSGLFENDGTTPTGLEGLLRSILRANDAAAHEVHVCGLATDFCVSYTALDVQAHVGDRMLVWVLEHASRAIDLNGSLDAARQQWRQKNVRVIQG